MMIRRPIMLVLLAASVAFTAEALPRFSSRTGFKCQSCHVNPSGGAMRLANGVQYGREQLPVPEWSKEFEVEDFSNVITNILGVGADVRTLFFYQRLTDTTTLNGFWQMQGDIYLNFRIARKISFFLKKGLRDGFEAYGLFSVLPATGYVKVGKFLPNYGLRIDDHTTYIRQVTGMSPERGRVERTGLELAISPGPLTFSGGMYNAEEGNFPTSSSKKAILGRAEGLFNLGEELFLGLGGNVFIREVQGVRSTYYGGFGSFSVGRLTVFGEADLVRNKTPGGTTVKELVTYVEGDMMITQGLDLKLAFDFHDLDLDLKSGTKSRYSVGFEFFPVGGVEVRPVYRIVRENPSVGNRDEFHLLLHLYL
ncbi:MAG: hypothetical protein AB1428_02095 [Bacteroidota bacterium]